MHAQMPSRLPPPAPLNPIAHEPRVCCLWLPCPVSRMSLVSVYLSAIYLQTTRLNASETTSHIDTVVLAALRWGSPSPHRPHGHTAHSRVISCNLLRHPLRGTSRRCVMGATRARASGGTYLVCMASCEVSVSS